MTYSNDWLPFEFYRDENGYLKRRMKDLATHPVTLELAQNAVFVERARAWAWRQHGPTNVPFAKQATTWPRPGARNWIGEYWHATFQRKREHDPANFVEVPGSLQEMVNLALAWSAARPMLEY